MTLFCNLERVLHSKAVLNSLRTSQLAFPIKTATISECVSAQQFKLLLCIKQYYKNMKNEKNTCKNVTGIVDC